MSARRRCSASSPSAPSRCSTRRRFRLARPIRDAHPAAAQRPARLRAPERRLRHLHRPGARRLPPAARPRGVSQCLDAATINELLNGVGLLPRPLPAGTARTSRATSPAAAGRDQRLAGLLDLPDQLRQAVDADGPRPLPRLLPSARLPARRDVLLETSSSAATPSTATTRRRTTRPATAACGCRSSTRSRSSTGSPSVTWSTRTCSCSGSACSASARLRQRFAGRTGLVDRSDHPADAARQRREQHDRVAVRDRLAVLEADL